MIFFLQELNYWPSIYKGPDYVEGGQSKISPPSLFLAIYWQRMKGKVTVASSYQRLGQSPETTTTESEAVAAKTVSLSLLSYQTIKSNLNIPRILGEFTS